jgi:flagellar biogenesis protein FliO
MPGLILTIIGAIAFISIVYWLRRRLGFRRVETEDQLLDKSDSAHFIGRP